ncbi:MAG TPA: helix-turn-helix transcriptional regulator [Tepidisphaeraceae bacterium]|nr:helix-turn-helix transcriptional regulator [Tepidisphaeraceae bacterium]
MGETDVKELIGLAKALYGPESDARLRREKMISGLCQIVTAAGGVSAILSFEDQWPRVESLVQAGDGCNGSSTNGESNGQQGSAAWGHMSDMLRDGYSALTRTRGQVLRGEKYFSRSAPARAKQDRIYSIVRLSDAAAAMLCLSRNPDQKPFTQSDAKLVHLIHSEMDVLYRSTPARFGIVGMTPRQQQIQEYLLMGHGEKQIANEMGLSRHTVHAHVKAVYRHFGVTSRPELLARFVNE